VAESEQQARELAARELEIAARRLRTRITLADWRYLMDRSQTLEAGRTPPRRPRWDLGDGSRQPHESDPAAP